MLNESGIRMTWQHANTSSVGCSTPQYIGDHEIQLVCLHIYDRTHVYGGSGTPVEQFTLQTNFYLARSPGSLPYRDRRYQVPVHLDF